jgi:hypothetical protein
MHFNFQTLHCTLVMVLCCMVWLASVQHVTVVLGGRKEKKMFLFHFSPESETEIFVMTVSGEFAPLHIRPIPVWMIRPPRSRVVDAPQRHGIGRLMQFNFL